jgi:hypothetical protein
VTVMVMQGPCRRTGERERLQQLLLAARRGRSGLGKATRRPAGVGSVAAGDAQKGDDAPGGRRQHLFRGCAGGGRAGARGKARAGYMGSRDVMQRVGLRENL